MSLADTIEQCYDVKIIHVGGDAAWLSKEQKQTIVSALRAVASETRLPEAERLLREWLKKAAEHPETREYRGNYQPFLERATRAFLDGK